MKPAIDDAEPALADKSVDTELPVDHLANQSERIARGHVEDDIIQFEKTP